MQLYARVAQHEAIGNHHASPLLSDSGACNGFNYTYSSLSCMALVPVSSVLELKYL